jgi:hypothetical protein
MGVGGVWGVYTPPPPPAGGRYPPPPNEKNVPMSDEGVHKVSPFSPTSVRVGGGRVNPPPVDVRNGTFPTLLRFGPLG